MFFHYEKYKVEMFVFKSRVSISCQTKKLNLKNPFKYSKVSVICYVPPLAIWKVGYEMEKDRICWYLSGEASRDSAESVFQKATGTEKVVCLRVNQHDP